MSFVAALPAELESAAGELHSIGCAAAAGSFAAHRALYQELSAQATAIHELFVSTLGASAGSYAATEAANAAAVH